MHYEVLTQEAAVHFLDHGWVKIPGCFTGEQAKAVCNNLWTRLGMDPRDKSTWKSERINLPAENIFSSKDFAPKAWRAICELLGGEEKVSEQASPWGDDLIVNLGTEQGDGQDIPGSQLYGWHVDGDFFVHYLDSPEQALVVIPLFSDIQPGGGGTLLCPNGIGHVARHLFAHPEGVSMWMTPRAENPTFEPEPALTWHNEFAQRQPADALVEATGSIGDVYLLHPFMIHSAANNRLRQLRLITNPHVSIKEPFVFDRADSKYSLVEQKTLRELGKRSLPGWKITAARELCVPERQRQGGGLKEQELEKLKFARDSQQSGVPNLSAVTASY